jgi:hypothetical protein
MPEFPAGTVGWAVDPTNAHDFRPVIVLCHEKRPFSATDWTVMCAGTEARNHDDDTPELEPQHVTGISFSDTTYLMPYGVYTIAPGAIRTGMVLGQLMDS